MNKDIKIYGTLLNYTTDDTIAYAKQVFDTDFGGGEKQSEINKRIGAVDFDDDKTIINSNLSVSGYFDGDIVPAKNGLKVGTDQKMWGDGYFEDLHVDGWIYTDFVSVGQDIEAGNIELLGGVSADEARVNSIETKDGDGNIAVRNSLIPQFTDTIDLGDAQHVWGNLYVSAINGRNIDQIITSIDNLMGSGDGSISKMIDDRIAAVIAGAPASLDTLKEISDWISSHEDSAAAMNSRISQNTADILSLRNDVDNWSIPENLSIKKLTLGETYDGNTRYGVDLEYANGNLKISGGYDAVNILGQANISGQLIVDDRNILDELDALNTFVENYEPGSSSTDIYEITLKNRQDDTKQTTISCEYIQEDDECFVHVDNLDVDGILYTDTISVSKDATVGSLYTIYLKPLGSNDNNITVTGNLIPDTELSRSLGNSNYRWNGYFENLYVGDLYSLDGNELLSGINDRLDALEERIQRLERFHSVNVTLNLANGVTSQGYKTNEPYFVGDPLNITISSADDQVLSTVKIEELSDGKYVDHTSEYTQGGYLVIGNDNKQATLSIPDLTGDIRITAESSN